MTKKSTYNHPGFRGRLACLILGLTVLSGALPAREGPGSGGGEPKIALVLSGGAALGFAHIGFLKVLEEVGIPVDIVIGNSMGSLIGGLYASGYSPGDIERAAEEINWGHVFLNNTTEQDVSLLSDKTPFVNINFDHTGRGKSKGLLPDQNITLLLSRLVYRVSMTEDFSALPLSFKTIAVDISKGIGVPLERGILYRAMRSSMSFPILFPPVPMDGAWFVDGAMVDNNPIDLALAWGADIIIDVDVGSFSPRDLKEIDSLEAVTNQTIRLIQSTSGSFNQALGRENYRLAMDLNDFFWTDFARFRELIDRGEQNARSAESMKALLALAEEIVKTRPLTIRGWRRRGTYQDIPEPVFTQARLVSIDTDGRVESARADMERLSPRFIDSLFNEFFDIPVAFDKLEMMIEIVRQRGNYESVGYHLESLPEGGCGLVLTGVRNHDRKNDFSLAMDTAFNFSSSVNLGITEYIQMNFRDLFAPSSVLSVDLSYAFSRVQGPASSLRYTKKLSPLFSLRGETEGAYYASSVHGYQPEGELSSFAFVDTGARIIYTPADFLNFHLVYHYEPIWYRGKNFNSRIQSTETAVDYFADLHTLKLFVNYDTIRIRQPFFGGFLSNLTMGLTFEYPFAGSRYYRGDDSFLYENLALSFKKVWTPRPYRRFIHDTVIASYRGDLESIWTLLSPVGKEGIPGYSGTEIMGREKIILGLTYLEELRPLSNLFGVRSFLALTLRSGNVWEDLDRWERFKELRGGLRAGLQLETPLGTLFLGPECSFDGKFQFCVYYN
jgi:predicted acylesterase/phospholipase RssA